MHHLPLSRQLLVALPAARQRRQQGQCCCDSLQSHCSLTVWISHQPFRLPFFLTIIPFWEREAMIRLTVRSDFPMDVAISFWSIRLFLEMQSNTARSSKVTFKVPFWPFGEENNILISSIRKYNKNTRAVVLLTETSLFLGRLGQIRPKNVGDVPVFGTSPTLLVACRDFAGCAHSTSNR